MLPQCLGEPLRSPADEPVLVISVCVDNAEDFQDGVGKVGVPAAGAEAYLAERLPVRESRLFEGLAGGDEAVERLLVHEGQEFVPDFLDPGGVPCPDGVLHVAELCTVVHGGLPGIRHLAEERRQVLGRGGVVLLAGEFDHGAGGYGRQRIREVLGVQAQQVHIVVESLAGHREPHPAKVRHYSRC